MYSFTMIKRLPFAIEQDLECNEYIASDDVFNCYGTGTTATEATDDYFISLMEYYLILESQEDENSAQQLSLLQQYIIRDDDCAYVFWSMDLPFAQEKDI